MADEITSRPRDDIRSARVRKAIAEAGSAGSREVAIKRLDSVESEVELLQKRARSESQRMLLEDYYVERRVQEALGTAALLRLLDDANPEIRLKAARELRGRTGGGGMRVDKAVVISPPAEDPEITRLRQQVEGERDD